MDIRKINEAGLKTLEFAANRNLAVCLTVVDRGGHIVYQVRMDGANYITNEVSYRKAKTAFLFNCPSHVLRTVTEQMPVLLQTIQQVPGDACLLEGGLPLSSDSKTIGGIGVSGGNFEEDLSVATVFADAFRSSAA